MSTFLNWLGSTEARLDVLVDAVEAEGLPPVHVVLPGLAGDPGVAGHHMISTASSTHSDLPKTNP